MLLSHSSVSRTFEIDLSVQMASSIPGTCEHALHGHSDGWLTSTVVSRAAASKRQGGWLSLLGRVDIKLIAQGTFADIVLIVPANCGDWTNTTKAAVLFYHSSLVQSMDVSDGFSSPFDYFELLILLTAKCAKFLCWQAVWGVQSTNGMGWMVQWTSGAGVFWSDQRSCQSRWSGHRVRHLQSL